MKDGFSPDDIQFAVKWTLANTKNELYDFSIIKHTIGQAMAAKAEIEARKSKRMEVERAGELDRIEKEKEQANRERAEKLKAEMDLPDRAALRERAKETLRATDGIKENFISDALIKAQENKILRGEV